MVRVITDLDPGAIPGSSTNFSRCLANAPVFTGLIRIDRQLKT